MVGRVLSVSSTVNKKSFLAQFDVASDDADVDDRKAGLSCPRVHVRLHVD